jgi:hypothetical protein
MNDRRRWALAALTAGVVVAVVRRWTSRGRGEYTIWPDEPAQLAVARFIGGGTRWNMDDHSVWRPLFGTLLAPAYWFTDDPVTVLHVAFVLNAVLGGFAAALLVFVARRLTPLSPWWGAAAAVAVSLAPAVLFTSEFVFAESLVAPLFLGTLLALLHLHEAPTLRNGLVAAVLAGAAFGAHSRMLPLAAIVLAVVTIAAFRRRLRVRDASIIAVTAVGALGLVEIYTRWIVDRLWDEPSARNSPSAVFEQLTSGLPVLVSLIGQSWYLLVASLGVIVYGLVVLARRSRDRDGGPATGDAHVVLATVGACFALSVVFMSDRLRSDQLVYGRYNDAVVTPVLVVGLAALFGSIAVPRLLRVGVGAAAGTMLGGVVLWSSRRDVLERSNGLEPMLLGLQPFATSATSIDVLRISAVAAVLTVALAAIATSAPRGQGITVGALSVLLVLGWMRTGTILDRSWDDSGDVSAVQELGDGVLRDQVVVDFHLPPGSTRTNRMMLYQFYLPHTEFSVVNRASEATADYVFARLDAEPETFADPPARLVWVDPRGSYGLFRR